MVIYSTNITFYSVFSWDKCNQIGIIEDGHVSFPKTNRPLRTDDGCGKNERISLSDDEYENDDPLVDVTYVVE